MWAHASKYECQRAETISNVSEVRVTVYLGNQRMIFQISSMFLKDFINDRNGYHFLNSIFKDREKSLLNEFLENQITKSLFTRGFYHYNPISEPFTVSIIWFCWFHYLCDSIQQNR